MKPIAFGLTDCGRVRAANEDALLVEDGLRLYVVADGMGGHKSGEVASHMACDVIRDAVGRSLAGGVAFMGNVDRSRSREANLLGSAVRMANRAVFEAAHSDTAWQGMGTTVVAVLCGPKSVGIAHVGDSRVYLFRHHELRPLTADHSLVAEQVRQGLITAEEAEKSGRKNVITRALGQWEEVDVDLADQDIAPGDRLVLCSDGLSGMVPDGGIAAVLAACPQPEMACRELVEAANVAGGKDNITALVVAFDEEAGFVAGLKRVFGKLS